MNKALLVALMLIGVAEFSTAGTLEDCSSACSVSTADSCGATGVDYFDQILREGLLLGRLTLQQIQEQGNPAGVTACHFFYERERRWLCVVYDLTNPEAFDFEIFVTNTVKGFKAALASRNALPEFCQQLLDTKSGIFFGIRNPVTEEYITRKCLTAKGVIQRE